MKWKKVAIKDICTGIYDGPHATPPLSDTGAIFLGISNFNNGRLDFSDIRYISEDDLPKWTKRVIPQKNDIVFSYEATLNLYAIIPEGFRGCLGRRMALLRVDETKADYKFLYYYFYSDAWRATVNENIVLGATVDRIPLIKFPDFPVELPPLETQHRIADILSAYDDLIENNQKQIKLLEEAAQRLYKEWFVDLRFPGYENTKIVDGIPEGWRRGLLKELISVNYGKDHKKAPDDGNIPVYGSGGLMRKCNKSLFSGEAVLIPRKGSLNNIMYVDETFWTVDTMFYATMKQPHTAVFVYFFVKAFDMYSMNIGAAVPSMTTKILDAMDVVIPDKETLEKFDKLTKTHFNKIKTLQGQNERLKTARDLLLPKFMSGKVEV